MLLVHGLLHLVGFDHELGEQQLQDMAQQEAALLSELGWEGSGLISLADQQAPSSFSSSSSSIRVVTETRSSSGGSDSSESDSSDTGSVRSVSTSSSVGGSRCVVGGVAKQEK